MIPAFVVAWTALAAGCVLLQRRHNRRLARMQCRYVARGQR